MALHQRLVHCVVMGCMMSLILSGAVTLHHMGFHAKFFGMWAMAWATAFPVAVLAIFLIAPLAMRLSMALADRLSRAT